MNVVQWLLALPALLAVPVVIWLLLGFLLGRFSHYEEAASLPLLEDEEEPPTAQEGRGRAVTGGPAGPRGDDHVWA